MQPRQTTILGVGLLGGSLALAIHAKFPACRIIGYGHRADTLRRAVEMGAIDIGSADAAESVAGSDLVILCTPVGLFDDLLRQIAPALWPGCIVTDVGSTKRAVVKSAREILPAGAHFVASHPIAGSEKRGVEFARADLFRDALCILTPAPDTHAASLQSIENFWQSLSMRTVRLTPEDHDRFLADVSHLPHLLAAALVSMPQDAAMALAGKGLFDTTRIAGGDGGLWRDIFLENADNLRESVGQLQKQLASVLEMLDQKKADELKDWLNAAAARRERWLQRRK
jgi:prephenate dehydrogenase